MTSPNPYSPQNNSEGNPYGNYTSGSSNHPVSQTPPTYGNAYEDRSSNYNNSMYTNPAYGSNTAGHTNGYGLSQPRPHVGFGEALKKWKNNMFHFSGRASRSEFWWVALLWVLIMFGLVFITAVVLFGQAATMETSAPDEALTASEGWFVGSFFFVYILVLVLGLVQTVTTLALGWRRLQDAGFPGWLYLLNFVGLGIVPLVMSIMPSSPSGYQYDKPVDYKRP